MKTLQVVAIGLLVLVGAAALLLPHPELYSRNIGVTWVVVARHMGINNMVSAVYLGPRAMDTLIEAMVVVLTVFGMKYIRDKT